MVAQLLEGDLETKRLQPADVVLNTVGGVLQFKESSSSQWGGGVSETRSITATQLHFCMSEP